MTVKKRLTQSNVIMILVPVIITSLIIACCACGAYIVLRSRSGIAFEKSGDFRKTVAVASEEFHEMFEHGTDSKKLRISSLANIINKDSMFLIVYEDGKEFYKNGNAMLQNKSAENSAAELGNNSFLSSDNIQLYHYETVSEDLHYDMYIYNLAVSEFPARIKPIEQEPWKSRGVRRMLCKNYYVYFRIDENTKRVYILNVIYSRSDQLNILKTKQI